MAEYTGGDYTFPTNNFRVPFMSWNRLEGRPRHEDFSDSVAMSIHDPLWMLARQWQFGELKAEDMGSAILSKMVFESKKLSHHAQRSEEGGFKEYPLETIPLEIMIEKLTPRMTVMQQAEMGKQLLRILQKSHLGAGGASQNFELTKSQLIQSYAFVLPSQPTINDWQTRPKDIEILANSKSRRVMAALSGRAVNGWKAYSEIIQNLTVFGSTIDNLSGDIPTMLAEYVDWVNDTYQLPELSNWRSASLDYGHKVAMLSDGGHNLHDVMVAKEYDSGRVDWYSYDRDTASRSDIPVSSTNPAVLVTSNTVSVIPTPAHFKGMPKKRLWELEDAEIDFAHLDVDRTEIIKQIVAEYSLVYSNDWFVLPYSFELNSFNRLKGMVVTDVFGQHTLLQSSTMNSPLVDPNTQSEWTRWGFMCNDRIVEGSELPNIAPGSSKDDSIWIAPALTSTHQSEPVEETYFIRDEIDNRVWAVEARVFSEALGSREGKLVAEEISEFLSPIAVEVDIAPYYAELVFKLGDTVPENWIPFIPVQREDGRSIVLQRAALPRHILSGQAHIRPKTSLLREGISDSDVQQAPFFLNEEEIPRSGLLVTDEYQRTRWHGGRTFLWYSRKTKTAKHPATSGLSFDNIEFKGPNEVPIYEPAESAWTINDAIGASPGIGSMTIGLDFEID